MLCMCLGETDTASTSVSEQLKGSNLTSIAQATIEETTVEDLSFESNYLRQYLDVLHDTGIQMEANKLEGRGEKDDKY